MSQNTENTSKKSLSSLDDSFDIMGLLLDYLSNIKYFILCSVICCGIGYYLYSTKTPTYNVSASIYLNNESQSSGSFALNSTPEAMLGPTGYLDETELEILKSRNSIVNIVDTLGLVYKYYKVGKFKDIPVYGNNPIVAEMSQADLINLSSPIQFNINEYEGKYKVILKTNYHGIDTDEEFVTSLPAKVQTPHGEVNLSLSKIASRFDGEQKIIIDKRLSVAQSISSNLTIAYSPNSMTIIKIIYSTPVIAMGEDIIYALVDLYNQNIIEDKNRSAVQTEEFILDRLVMISSELKDVEQRLENYKRDHNIATSVESQAAIYSSKTDATAEQLDQIDLQLQLLDEVNAAVLRQNDYSPIAQICDDAELSSLIEQYNTKVSQLHRTLETVTNDNPLAVKMKDDISREKSKLVQSIRSVKNNLLARRRAISSKNTENSGKLATVPTIDKGLQEIFREQQVKVNIYTFLLQRREEIALQKALATPTAYLIDSPLGIGPISPKLSSHIGASLLIGLLIPALIIFLIRLFFPVFKDKDELKRVTDVSILGEICHIDGKVTGIILKENSDDNASELIKLLRVNIEMVLNGLGKDKNVILTTSTISGEGKSFCVANIAAAFAIKGKKVLVIGADVRRPVIHHLYNVDREPGLTNFLMGNITDYKDIIKSCDVSPNLYIVPTGPIPPNPNELLSNGKFEDLLAIVRKEYDYVFIDSAPVGIISDTLIISHLSDMQLYIARANYTKRNCISIMKSEIASGRLSHCYLILNDVNITSSSYSYRRYGNYGNYGNYGYGYGYGNHTKKQSWWNRLLKKIRK